MAKTKIEWTDGGASWNPIRARRKNTDKVGWHCERVSEACRNCYAAAMNRRGLPNNGTGLDYTRDTRDRVEIFLDEKVLLQPLSWRKPRKIFVCSTTDIFGEWVTDDMLDRIFAVMALCPQHTFQVLTKRPKRMREYMSADRYDAILPLAIDMHKAFGAQPTGWPLPNIWLGITAENQAAADERIPELLATPAAVRWVSIEPMLGPVDLRILSFKSGDDLPESMRVNDEHGSINALRGTSTWPGSHYISPTIKRRARISDGEFWETSGENVALDWICLGGESGPYARDSNLVWHRSVRDQCKAAGVAFFEKQITERGKKVPFDEWPTDLQIRQFPEVTR